MGEQFSIRAYWGPRKETIHECANRLLRFVKEISKRSEVFEKWHEKSRRRGNATRKMIEIDEARIVDLLRRGRNREDATGNVIEDLGFHVSLWNGCSDQHVSSFSIACGSYCRVAGVGLNCLLFDLPEALGPLGEASEISSLFLDVIQCWEPEHAALCSASALRERAFDASRPFVDWIVYVAGLQIAQTAVPDEAQVTDLGSGTMVHVVEWPTMGQSPEHLTRVEQVTSAIIDAMT